MIDNLNRKQGPYWERSREFRPNWLQFPSIAKRGGHKTSARAVWFLKLNVLEWKNTVEAILKICSLKHCEPQILNMCPVRAVLPENYLLELQHPESIPTWSLVVDGTEVEKNCGWHTKRNFQKSWCWKEPSLMQNSLLTPYICWRNAAYNYWAPRKMKTSGGGWKQEGQLQRFQITAAIAKSHC